MKLNKHQELVRDHYCRGEYSYVTDTSQIVPSWSGDGLFTFLMLEAGGGHQRRGIFRPARRRDGPDSRPTKAHTMKYTVLLLRPDYLADAFGHDTYLAWVEASSVERAIELAQMEAWEASSVERAMELAQLEAWEADNGGLDSPEDATTAGDYHVLFMCEGHVGDLKP